jgi:soluble cytochrome b562
MILYNDDTDTNAENNNSQVGANANEVVASAGLDAYANEVGANEVGANEVVASAGLDAYANEVVASAGSIDEVDAIASAGSIDEVDAIASAGLIDEVDAIASAGSIDEVADTNLDIEFLNEIITNLNENTLSDEDDNMSISSF